MPRFTIPRRTVLRAGGATLALPALDIMTRPKEARAAGGIKRFLTAYASQSISSAADARNYPNQDIDFVTPKKTGRDWEITQGLQMIRDFGVKAEMGVLSGLTIPVATAGDRQGHDVPGALPRGSFHGCTYAPQAAGMANLTSSDHEDPFNPCAATCDQIMVPVLSAPDQFMPSLVLQLSPDTVVPGGIPISFKEPGPNARKDFYGRPYASPVSPMTEPDKIYRKLFGDTAPMTSTPATGGPAADLPLKRRRSVVDAVYERLQFILKRCSADDRRVLTRYADHIRKLETQIAQLKPAIPIDGGKILPPPAPIVSKPLPYPKDNIGQELYDKNAGWADEKLRGPLQAELIHAALLTDRTRVVSWMVLHGLVNLYPLISTEGAVHQVTHDPAQPNKIAASLNWAIGQLAHLVALLGAPEARDPDGSRILDNTALGMYFEGGWGQGTEYTEESAARFKTGYMNPHSVENMMFVMAGGASLGLHSYQHARFSINPGPSSVPRQGRYPGEAILTQMRALGYDGPLNQINATIPEMTRPPA